MDPTPESVYHVVVEHGPIIPNEIRKVLGAGDSTLIRVYLSQLKDERKILLTHTKLGASSFAYVPEQKEQLENLMQHLNEKDKRVAHQLRTEKVMRSATVEPLTRVALQTIKDFAIPIKVKTDSGEEIFYRYFLFSSEDAQIRVRSMLGASPKKEESVEKPAPKPAEEKPPEKKEEPKPAAKEVQKPLAQDVETTSDFGKQLVQYFSEKQIVMREFEEKRKNSDIECVIEMPTPVGTITYFCKAKNKKKSNDGDLASAILAAKKHMLPALYLTTGTITKKAKQNKEFGEITVVELGN